MTYHNAQMHFVDKLRKTKYTGSSFDTQTMYTAYYHSVLHVAPTEIVYTYLTAFSREYGWE